MVAKRMRVAVIPARVFWPCLILALIGEIATLSVTYHTAYPYLRVLGAERLLLGLLLLMVAAHGGSGLSSFGFNGDRIADGFKRGLIWSFFTGLGGLLLFAILYAAHIPPLTVIKTALPAAGPELGLFLLVGGLIGPVVEELFFRGIVYGFLRRWGVVLALVATSAAFVAAHWEGATVPLAQTIGGIIFAIAYEVEGSLLVPITIHVLGNTAIFVLSLIGGFLA